MTAVPLLVHRGDEQHGVDRYAREVAAAVARARDDARLVLPADVPDGAAVHVHFTDRLWGSSPGDAAEAIERIAARGPVTVTLHDLPQPSDGEASLARRSDAYRRVVRAASAVVCNSRHELALLRTHVDAEADATVVPLPCEQPDEAPRPATVRREIGVLGFFYPGKGHREAVVASATLADPLPVTAIGRAAPGHERELAALVAEAAEQGVAVTSTGFLDDDALRAAARSALVPVVAHRHVSASGSLTAWTAAGRRPIVVRNAYFDEMAALRPGTMWIVEESGLAGAIELAARVPETTWLQPGSGVSPTIDDVAEAMLALWDRA
ncbi:hypothetical protein GCM10009846_30990 [Agrococcus versicolor]|uniref:D-inositol 3-phosphate glycosyltransferase n=1 Tax=Agrococcus versicolor TaxID=501482 RepID=A0ABP5MQB4_9MICO